MTRFVIVTGTDTGVGKTFVTEALARLLSRSHRVVAIKPFESGVTDEPGDGERLAAATGQKAPLHALVRLKEPLTPALAADREGVTIDFEAALASIRAHAEGADFALIEGAGGVLSPLTWEKDTRSCRASSRSSWSTTRGSRSARRTASSSRRSSSSAGRGPAMRARPLAHGPRHHGHRHRLGRDRRRARRVSGSQPGISTGPRRVPDSALRNRRVDFVASTR